MREFLDINIGVAVQTNVGLLVPVLPNADARGLSAISSGVKDLAGKAGLWAQGSNLWGRAGCLDP